MDTANNNFKHEKTAHKKLKGVIYIVLVVILFSAASSLIYYRNYKKLNNDLELQQSEKLNDLELTIHNEMRFAINPIVIISDSPIVENLLKNNSEIDKIIVNKSFLTVISNIKSYSSIGIISADGHELVRISRNNEGGYYTTPKSSLSYLGNQNDFIEAIKTQDKIYISDFEIKSEGDVSYTPHVPIIRLFSQIVDEEDNIMGVVTLNILLEELISEISLSNTPADTEILVINDYGYYLHSNDRRDSSFPNDFPEAWDLINKNFYHFEDDSNIFFVRRINPVNQEYYDTTEKYWFIVSKIPNDIFDKQNKELIFLIIITALIILPLVIFSGIRIDKLQVINKSYKEELINSANTDGLTGLYNRKTIIQYLDELIGLSKRNALPLSIVFIDLNDLKYVNDNYGHKIGDKMLIATSVSLLDSVRETDLVSRIGGDEFLIILPDCDSENAYKIMSKASAVLEKAGLDAINMPWTMSYGCATYKDGESTYDFINRADKLMYEFKKEHKES